MANFYAFYPPGGGSNASVGTTGAPAPTSATEIGIIDPGGNLVGVSGESDGSINVNVVSAPALPDYAKESKQDDQIVQETASALSLAQIEEILDEVTAPPGSGNNGRVMSTGVYNQSGVAIPLTLGQDVMANSLPVAIASDQSAIPTTISGNVTVVQPTGTNLHTVIDSSALPTGAATAANQTSQITQETAIAGSTASIDSKLGTLGQKTMAGSAPVVIASDQSAIPASISGNVTVVQPTGTNLHTVVDSSALPTGAATSSNQGSQIVLETAISNSVASMDLKMSNGAQKTQITDNLGNAVGLTSGALNVDVINFPATQPVSGTVTVTQATGTNLHAVIDSGAITVSQATGTNLHTVVDSGTVAATQSGTWNITNVSGTISLPTGAATETSLAKLTLAQGSTTSGQSGNLNFGAVTTANPTYTTGQSSPLSLDTSGNLRVSSSAPASATATLTNVSGSASSVSILASNANRKQATFFNDSTAILYMKFGTTASTTSYTVQIPPGGYYEMPSLAIYTGAIDGIWSAANGAVRVTEY